MKQILQFVQNPAVFVPILYWFYNAAVRTMPDPTTTSSNGYKWLYGFLHLAAASTDNLKTLWNLFNTKPVPTVPEAK